MLNKRIWFVPIVLLFCFLSTNCEPTVTTKKENLQEGIWRGEITLQGQQLPFNFELEKIDSLNYKVWLLNASERLEAPELHVMGDSIFIPMHIFDASLSGKYTASTMKGRWQKHYAEGYLLPFSATAGKAYRFEPPAEPPAVDLTGKWEVSFRTEEGDSSYGIGIFNQEEYKLTGTFLTPTGDYRYLEGQVEGSTMKLSAFDGEHAYLFQAEMEGDSTLTGDYWSGRSSHETWTARRNEGAALPDANKLTYLKEGYDGIDFSFPNLQGQNVRLSDPGYNGKVVVLQLFGTWCPNCMDETKFLADWYRKNKDRGVEIIGLAYERKDDFNYASTRVEKMKRRLNVGYDFLIAGTSDKEKAAKTLPMLNHVMSFPTTIFIDRDGEVRRIHTGFSGPGTGTYYTEFVEDFNLFMDKLLAEES